LGRILDSVIRFFREDDWKFSQLEGAPVLRMGFSGTNGKWTCIAQAREDQNQFVFYSICAVNVPEDKRPAVAEYLTRANYGLVLGNFEFDLSDGEVRYKTSIAVGSEDLSPPLVKPLVYANVLMMDKYLPGLMAILYANTTPDQAIAQVEGE